MTASDERERLEAQLERVGPQLADHDAARPVPTTAQLQRRRVVRTIAYALLGAGASLALLTFVLGWPDLLLLLAEMSVVVGLFLGLAALVFVRGGMYGAKAPWVPRDVSRAAQRQISRRDPVDLRVVPIARIIAAGWVRAAPMQRFVAYGITANSVCMVVNGTASRTGLFSPIAASVGVAAGVLLFVMSVVYARRAAAYIRSTADLIQESVPYSGVQRPPDPEMRRGS